MSVLAEDFSADPYWWRAAPPEDAPEPPPAAADIVVVGAGYCGLACALELAEHGRRVAVLDAGLPGIGASTRSSGMVTGGQKFVVSGALDGLPPDAAARVLADAGLSLRQFEERLARYGLDADYVRSGRVILAAVPRHRARLERWTALLAERTGVATRFLPRDRLGEELAGDRYHAGLLIEDYGGIHPAKYHRALRRAAVAAGASLHGHAAAVSIARGAGGFEVRTKRGTVKAGAVFVATNGYTDGLLPFLRRRVVPVSSYVVATEPLPDGLAARLLPGRRMYSDTRRNLIAFRLSPDGTRILCGGRPLLRDVDAAAAARLMHRELCGVWPEMRDIRIAHCWRGMLGMTFAHMPHLGTADGVHFATGCNGSGIAMMSHLGWRVARRILGAPDGASAFDGLPFPAPPVRAARPWLVPLAAGWYRLRDGLDRVGG